MSHELEAPVFGVVENLPNFVCPSCGRESHILRSGPGERAAHELAVPFLGGVPLVNAA